MNQQQFLDENQRRGRSNTLDEWDATSRELVAEHDGNPEAVPDGGEWVDENGQGNGFVQVTPVMRVSYRNYCEWHELTLPSGRKGVYVESDAMSAGRFL